MFAKLNGTKRAAAVVADAYRMAEKMLGFGQVQFAPAYALAA